MAERLASALGFHKQAMSRKKNRFGTNTEKQTESPVSKTVVPVNAPKNWMVRFVFPLFVLICCVAGLVLLRTSSRSLPRGYPDLPDMTEVNPILREFLRRKDANARSHADSAEALGGLAMAYHANHFLESAKLAYQLAARLEPNDYRWFYCEALLEEDSAEPRTLVELLERTIQLQNYLPAYQKLAEHFSKRDELQKSAEVYARILKLDPSLLWAVVGQARISARQGNWSFVIQNLEPVAKQYPRVRVVHQLLADAYQAIGHSDQALESIKILAQSNLVPMPRVSDPQRDQVEELCYLSTPLLKLAYAAASAGQYEKMLQWSRRAVEVDAGDADAHHFLARALILARGGGPDVFAEAMAHRDEGLRLRADDPEPLMMLGQALMDRSNFKAAILQFEMLLTRKPEHAETHNSIAIALTGEGRFTEAVAHGLEAVRLKPEYAEAFNNLGNLLFQQRHWKQAQTYYLQAIEQKPDYAEANYNLGNVLAQEGKLESASRYFSAALRLKPDHAQAQNGLGVVLLQQGRTKQAIAHFSGALKFAPDFATAQYNWGLALAREGKLDEACFHFSEALRIKPNYPEAEESLRLVQNQQSKSFAKALKSRKP